MSVAVVVVAAGAGSRVGAVIEGRPTNKVLLGLGSSTVLGTSVRTTLAVPGLTRLVVVVRDGEHDAVGASVGRELPTPHQDDEPAGAAPGPHEAMLVTGAATRHGSEWTALRVLAGPIESGEVDVVVVHDAARPLADVALFEAVVQAAREHGGAIPVAPLTGLLGVDLTQVRGTLVGVQTPQAFRAGPLLAAHRQAAEDTFEGTDTAGVFRRWTQAHAPDLRVVAVPSTSANLKVTFGEDVALAERLLDA